MIGIFSDIFTPEPMGIQRGGKGQFSPGSRLEGHHKQNRNKQQAPLHWGRGGTKMFALGSQNYLGGPAEPVCP